MLDKVSFILALFVLITHLIFKMKNVRFSELPLAKYFDAAYVKGFHRWGLFFALGYVLLSLPSVLANISFN